jgi:hypothetical protein
MVPGWKIYPLVQLKKDNRIHQHEHSHNQTMRSFDGLIGAIVHALHAAFTFESPKRALVN